MRTERIKIAVLLDAPASAQNCGTNLMWEKLTQAAAASRLPVDVTLYRYGKPQTIALAPHARLLHLPPPGRSWHHYQQLEHHLDYFDIVHTTTSGRPFASTAARCRIKRRFALVHHFDASIPDQEAARMAEPDVTKPLRTWYRHLQAKRHLQRCDEVMVMLPCDQEAANRIVPPARISPLRTGADKSIFHPDRRCREALTEHFGIAPENLLILLSGCQESAEGAPAVLDSLQMLLGMGLPLHLLVVGNGSMTQDIKTKLGPHATLCGQKLPEEMGILYAGADLLLLPSPHGHGRLTLTEALACNLPVMLAAASPLAAAVQTTAAVKLVGSDAPAWSTALHRLFEVPDTLANMHLAAMSFSQGGRIPDWNTVLREDLYPVWQKLLQLQQQSQHKRAA